jgi:hypothetical protein
MASDTVSQNEEHSNIGKVKVKCTLVQVPRLCTGRTAHRGSGGIAHAPAALYPGKDPVPIVQEAGWAPGPV